MHIPDGYLSPVTCAEAAALAAPAWWVSARRLGQRLEDRQTPLLAAGAAFCFAIMMLNVPIPGGTTAHAVGGTLVAIILGPEAAVLVVMVALVIQALFFGDGGVLALGANGLNMAVILPICGYAVYRSRSRHMARPWAAALGAYAGINLAALAAAVELGIQPVLYHTSAGAPLYCPYHLQQTIPVMLLAHLTIAGGVEAVVTGMVVAFLEKIRQFPGDNLDGPVSEVSKTWAWRGVALLSILAPLGLLAPGSAFGELSVEELKKAIGFAPAGLERLAGTWRHALLPDYSIPNGASSLSLQQVAAYWLSALVGIAAIFGACWLLSRMLQRRRSRMATLARPGSGGKQQLLSGCTREDSIPAWLLRNPSSTACECSGQQRRASYLEKTLSDASGIVQQALFGEEIAQQPGYLQRLEPRVKVIALGLALIAASLLRHEAALLVLLGAAVALGLLSRIPLGVFLKRLTAIPLLTLMAALPALFNVVTPGRPIWTIYHLARPHTLGPFEVPITLSVTGPGIHGAAALVLRVAASVSVVLVLTLTTRWCDLLQALGTIGLPRVLLFVLAMVYRYLFLLVQTASDLFVARKSRSFGEQDTRSGRRFVAASIGCLFAKSYALSEEVHAAMVSRGYRGQLRTISRSRLDAVDLEWLVGAIGFLIALGIGDRLLG